MRRQQAMQTTSTESLNPQKQKLRLLTRGAVVTAALCVLAPFSIPLAGMVPISLATFVLYLSVYILDWKLASLSCLVYLLLGTVGMPVFSGFSGGLGKLLGPTGGYLIGYLPMVLIAGYILSKTRSRGIHFLAFVLGTAVCYAFGTAWYCFAMATPLPAAMAACVLPFIPMDLVKIIVAILIGPLLQQKLAAAIKN